MTVSEEFIFDTEQVATLHCEVTTTGESHRLAPSGAIERLGNWCTPIDNHRLAIVIGYCETADVEALGWAWLISYAVDVERFAMAVDPAEHQCRIAQIELREPIDEGFVEHIALVARLDGAPKGALVDIAEFPGVGAARFEAAVGVIDVGLFVSEIGVLVRHEDWALREVVFLKQGRKTLSAL
jgi:hypothetical protein